MSQQQTHMLTTNAGAPSQILCRQTVAGTEQPVESSDDENGTNDAACDKCQVILESPPPPPQPFL